jgi:PTS system mannose-specific IIB component/fructoselysine and glucoselysine-specific PTS system IIB component
VPIVLYRVDERLIHGQVVIGWGNELRPERYLVIDDELARSEWEQDLYRLAVSESEVVFASVEEARRELEGWKSASLRSILLTRDIGTMRRLAEGGLLQGEQVNLGGLHHAPGRERVLPYLFVSARDRDDLERLGAEGVEVSARDLPDAPGVPLASLLND